MRIILPLCHFWGFQAKLEAQHGHDHSEHAVRARKKKPKPEKVYRSGQPTEVENSPAKSADLVDSPPVSRRNRPQSPPLETRRSKSPELCMNEQSQPGGLAVMTNRNVLTEQQVVKSSRSNRKISAPASFAVNSTPTQEGRLFETPDINEERLQSLSLSQDPPPLPPRAHASSAEHRAIQDGQAEVLRSPSSISKSASDPNLLSKDTCEVPKHEAVGKRNSHEDECWYMPGIPR